MEQSEEDESQIGEAKAKKESGKRGRVMMDIGKDLQDAYECGRQDALAELMEYTYGMLTAEKFGLQHKIKSMMSDRKTEPQHDAEEVAKDINRRVGMVKKEWEVRHTVETMSCAECKHRPIGAEICEEPCRYEPKDEPQTDWHYDEQDATWYPYKHEDEPQQKSCATCKHALGNWDGESNNCGRCCGADRRFYEPKTEPTEREGE